MKRPLHFHLVLASIVVVLCVFLMPPFLHAAPSPAGETGGFSARGEILDLACYVAHGAKGPQHQTCAQKCAEQGQPIGLLAEDGKVYLLFADHANAAPFDTAKSLAGSKAEIKGDLASKDGINGVTVLAVKKL
jgi:hypothetical protein